MKEVIRHLQNLKIEQQMESMKLKNHIFIISDEQKSESSTNYKKRLIAETNRFIKEIELAIKYLKTWNQ